MAGYADTRRIEIGNSYIPASRESVAYDYSRFDTRERWSRPPVEVETARPKPARKRARIAVVTPNLVLLALIFLSLCVGVVWSSMLLTEKSNEAGRLKSELVKLKSEATMLQTKQDERFSLAVVEAYAVEELKMIKLTGDQLKYVDVSSSDSIEILDPEAENEETPLLIDIAGRITSNKS